MRMTRWAIYIDIEGFGNIYTENEVSALRSLGALMEGIYPIGTKVCPETPYRLFVHQTGDGFIIVSEFAERSPELPVSIAIVLMRFVLMSGGTAKAGVAKGEFGDKTGCYPDIIRQSMERDGTVRLGQGLMRIFPVMGTAQIKAYRLTRCEKGSLIIVGSGLANRLGNGIVVSKREQGYVVVDWIHSRSPALNEIFQKTGIYPTGETTLEERLSSYVKDIHNTDLRPWVENTLALNSL